MFATATDGAGVFRFTISGASDGAKEKISIQGLYRSAPPGSTEGRFAACFGERAGGDGFVDQHQIADREIALFEDEF